MTPTTEEIRGNLLAWIHDLETTDAKQGQGNLRSRANAYCCLGRACDVLGVAMRLGSEQAYEFIEPYPRSEFVEQRGAGTEIGFDKTGALPRSLRLMLGLSVSEMEWCFRMNDLELKTFKQIAAWLRANVLPRFPAKASVDHSVTETVAS